MSFATMVRPTFSASETMVGMPFRHWHDARAEGARYLLAGNYSARVAELDRDGKEIPAHGGGGFIYLWDESIGRPFPVRSLDYSVFDSLTTPAEA